MNRAPASEGAGGFKQQNRAMEWTIYHLLLIVAFVAIVAWVYSRKRKAGYEKDARIPFEKPDE